MGCSSSSAQTVDQEKRPGIKSEESNGDTVAVRNGIIAEDSQTIEDQMQLPVQTALPQDLQLGTDEAGAVLVALEAQEDLGSVEDLLAAPAPQPEPHALEEPAPEALDAATAEVFTEPEVALVAVEALHLLEEAAPVETQVKALVEAPDVEFVAAVQGEAPSVGEEVTAVPVEATAAVEPVVSEQAEAAVVVEEAVALVIEAPAEVATPVEEETASATPAESTEPGETLEQAVNEAAAVSEADSSVPIESSAPAEAEKPVINTEIAAATIPEMPLLSPVTVEVQAESQPAVKEAIELPVAPAETGLSPEAPCSSEATLSPAPEAKSDTAAAAEAAQVIEAPTLTPAVSETPAEVGPNVIPADVNSGGVSMMGNTAPGEATQDTSETNSGPAPAADLTHEPSPEGTSQKKESEKTKKED